MLQFGRDTDSPVSLKRRVLSLPSLVSWVLVVVFLVFLLTRFDVDLDGTWSHIRGGNPWYAAAALLVHYATVPFRGVRWQRLLHHAQPAGDPLPGVAYCSQLVLLGWFANSIGWLRVGDAYRAYLYVQENTGSFARTIGTILAERVLDTVLVAALVLVAVPLLLSEGSVSWIVTAMALGLAAALLLVLAALVGARNYAQRLLPSWLASPFQNFQQGTLGSLREVPLLSVWGLLAWMSEIARLYFVGQALGLDLSIPMAMFITLASSMLTLVPTPGGFGAVEPGVLGLLLRLTTLSSPAATAVVLVDRSISYLSVILVGAVLFLARQVFRRPVPAVAPSTSGKSG